MFYELKPKFNYNLYRILKRNPTWGPKYPTFSVTFSVNLNKSQLKTKMSIRTLLNAGNTLLHKLQIRITCRKLLLILFYVHFYKNLIILKYQLLRKQLFTTTIETINHKSPQQTTYRFVRNSLDKIQEIHFVYRKLSFLFSDQLELTI